ncbi:hypothetical protein, partial [Haloferula rosea]|uniref:hypothetical protein n=1 Tax=Haloferula rosea TaxID=490093 RepID=UPI001F27FBD6
LDSGLNNFFEVDSVNSMAYRYGRLGGVNTLSAINLLTGTAETVSYGGDPFAVYQVPEPNGFALLGLAVSLLLRRSRHLCPKPGR